MANNRMNLFCSICGATIMLAKFYPGSAYHLGFGLEEKLGQWLEDHAHGQQYGMYGPDHYEIAYEIEQQHAQ